MSTQNLYSSSLHGKEHTHLTAFQHFILPLFFSTVKLSFILIVQWPFREHDSGTTILRKKKRGTETLRLKAPSNLEFWIPFLAVFGIIGGLQLIRVQFLWASAMAEASHPYNISDYRFQLPRGTQCEDRSDCIFLLLAFLPEAFCSCSRISFLRHYMCSCFWKKPSKKPSSLSKLSYLPCLYSQSHHYKQFRKSPLCASEVAQWAFFHHRRLWVQHEPCLVHEGRFIVATLTAV